MQQMGKVLIRSTHMIRPRGKPFITSPSTPWNLMPSN
jgi:hypothetical protein